MSSAASGRPRVSRGPEANKAGQSNPAGGSGKPKIVRGADDMAGTSLKSSYRRVRSRAARACEVCHSRKVRCDVVTHQPCTNCIAFGCECVVPESRNRRAEAKRASSSTSVANANVKAATEIISPPPSSASKKVKVEADTSTVTIPSTEPLQVSPESMRGRPNLHSQERRAFFGPSSHVTLLLHNSKLVEKGSIVNEDGQEAVQLPLHAVNVELGGHVNLIDNNKMSITGGSLESDEVVLKLKGAFLLPPKSLADELVADFFTYVHPFIPVLDKQQFLAAFNSPKEEDKPPLMLRQAVFCAAARVSKSPALTENGSTVNACLTFYKRGKALFDADYDEDPIVNVQVAILFATALDKATLMKHSIHYWTRVAITMAQGVGIHRKVSVGPDALSPPTPLQRRIWWSLYVRDVSSAVSYGRPMMINLEDSDIDMLTEADFFDTDNEIHIQYFLYVVRLHEIMALVARQQYSVGAERLRRLDQLPDATQCDLALANWANTLPDILRYSLKDPERHELFRALLYLQYYTVLCLAHRPQVVRFSPSRGDRSQRYPSWGIAFQAGHMIVRILENLRQADEISRLPAVGIYTCFSALLMLSYQRESPQQSVVNAAQQAIDNLIETVKEMRNNTATAEWILAMAVSLRDNNTVRGRLSRTLKRSHEHSEPDGEPENVKKSTSSLPPVTFSTSSQQTSLDQSQSVVSSTGITSVANVASTMTPPMPESTVDHPVADDIFLATADRSLPATPGVTDALKLEELFPEGDTIFSGDPQTPIDGFTFFNSDIIPGPPSTSSGDEGVMNTAPNSLGMGDWYDFLMSR